MRIVLVGAAAAAEATKVNTEELVQRARGEIPERRPGQQPAERKRELDLALAKVPAMREERKQMAALVRQAAEVAGSAAWGALSR